MSAIYINAMSMASRLGMSVAETRATLAGDQPPRPDQPFELLNGTSTVAAALPGELSTKTGDTRTNQIQAHLLAEMSEELDALKARIAPDRIAVVVGTSTTGIEEGGEALKRKLGSGDWPAGFAFSNQELGDTAAFLAGLIGAKGPAWTVSTACTSGGKALAAAARLLNAGLADAVVCGGVDSLAALTLNGFAALDSVSPEACAPFSANRQGINIGEGGALFILSREAGPWRLTGWGESSDAYHMSSPHPEGEGAEVALQQAMLRAGLEASGVGFIHMHGTATPLNDQMESRLVNRLFGAETPCASTKGMTGHTLGAAGAIQAALNLMALDDQIYPPHVFDGAYDPDLPPVRLTQWKERADAALDTILSASYAFGGSNVALMFARG